MGSAFAQDEAPAPKPVASSAPTAVKVNPFTGKALKFEEITRQLEASKLQTQLLEEELKQTNIQEETRVVPARKAVELAQAKSGIRKEEATIAAMTETIQQTKSVKKNVSAKKKAESDQALRQEIEAKIRAEMAVSQAQRVVIPTLTAVLTSAGSRTAVLDFEGSSLLAQEGEATPAGVVHIKDDSSIEVGGRTLKVHDATISRFVVSDKKVDPKQVATTNKPAVASAPAAVAAAPVQGSFQLPPLVPPPVVK